MAAASTSTAPIPGLTLLPVDILLQILDLAIEKRADAKTLALVSGTFYKLVHHRRGWDSIALDHLLARPDLLHRLMSFYQAGAARRSSLECPLKETSSLVINGLWADDVDNLCKLMRDTILFDGSNWGLERLTVFNNFPFTFSDEVLALLRSTLKSLTLKPYHDELFLVLSACNALGEVSFDVCWCRCCFNCKCWRRCFRRDDSSDEGDVDDRERYHCEVSLHGFEDFVATRGKRAVPEAHWEEKLLSGNDEADPTLALDDWPGAIKKLKLTGHPLNLFRKTDLVARGSFEHLERLELAVETYVEGLTLAILSCRRTLRFLRLFTRFLFCDKDDILHKWQDDEVRTCGPSCRYGGFADMCSKLGGGKLVSLHTFEPAFPDWLRRFGADSFFDLIEQTPSISNFTVLDRERRIWDFKK